MEPGPGASWLVAGLGNPGPTYQGTRHNLGFAVLDRLAAGAAGRFRAGRHAAMLLQLDLGGARVCLVKPQTFMNGCGPAVAAWRAALELPEERLLVVHDDLDLPLGGIRVVAGGGAAGHRGVASIQAAVGSAGIPRVRVGIGRPPATEPAAEFVLRPFEPAEIPRAAEAVARAAEAVARIVAEGLPAAMTQFNTRPPSPAEAAGSSD